MSASKLSRKASLHVLRFLSLVIGGVLGLFCNRPGPIPTYGMPYADYQISGTVLSADQDAPVKGLSVSLRDTLNASAITDSGVTDSLGRYSLQFSGAPWENTWVLKVRDVDSIENGSFRAKDTVISIPESDLREPSGNWYEGHGEKIVDVKIARND
jgi:putative lipoprotein (rSAM/lipoprotein system)